MIFKAKKKFSFSHNGIDSVPLGIGDEITINDAASVVSLIKEGYLEEVKEVKKVKAVPQTPNNKMVDGPVANKRPEQKKNFNRKK